MKTNKGQRHGRHREGNVLLGSMVEPEKKAIAIVTAAALAGEGRAMTQTEIIWEGISRIAQSVGVIDTDGKVTPKYQDAVALAKASVIEGNKSNRATRGGRRGA